MTKKAGASITAEDGITKSKTPATKMISNIKKQANKDKVPIQPLVLFPYDGSPTVKQRPAHLDPLSQGK